MPCDRVNLKRLEDEESEVWSVSEEGYGAISFGTYRRKKVVKKDFKYMNTITERIYNYREAYALSTCNHPNIVKFIGAGPNTRIANVRYVVIERATDASLKENYLHSRAELIIHRDLKPANMLLFDGCTTLKISDFGSSKILKRSVNQGSLLYMAPEVKQPLVATTCPILPRTHTHITQNTTVVISVCNDLLKWKTSSNDPAFALGKTQSLNTQEQLVRLFGDDEPAYIRCLDARLDSRLTKDKFYTGYSKSVDIYTMTVSISEILTRRLDEDVNPNCVKIHSCPQFLNCLFDR
ncbi:Mitogen-activated protein kinase kinase kinase 7 [Echinococcus granulosus]|uniref:Mitogen-activated protein kinase kinase kinase 7 n=1 Tax=Echinococcus granulosus TaxID=6210 RepID=W6U5U9_ECHGR|nr:Mitogen-activated protein kinase kinase kinase 7 [Echinococcus granulosus]EUB56553.1 Mitogen-activated protein kinase kinase kinase 7 [Echinococcus granulosus]